MHVFCVIGTKNKCFGAINIINDNKKSKFSTINGKGV